MKSALLIRKEGTVTVVEVTNTIDQDTSFSTYSTEELELLVRQQQLAIELTKREIAMLKAFGDFIRRMLRMLFSRQ